MGKIGIFDSGYGGLTIAKSIVTLLPENDYIYLGDNLKAPYGNLPFETVYEYTLDCVKWLFEQDCELIILACNTASAKALRTIQMNDLPKLGKSKRVLGVIRPTAEVIGQQTITNSVGILGTQGTINSESYPKEITNFYPNLKVFQQACPLWVPLIENNDFETKEAKSIFKKDIDSLLSQEKDIDTLLLACTHYPLLINILKDIVPENITLLSQGNLVAHSLKEYIERHPELGSKISQHASINFYTTGDTNLFNQHASLFFGAPICAKHCIINS